MAKAKAKVSAKIKKKFWFPIVAPKVFNNVKMGEMYMPDANAAIGRTFWHGLKELTENMRDQNVYLNFKIKTFANNNLNTEMIGYKMTPTSIKKMVRRHNDRSDDSFILKTSDNKKIRIKTLILTPYNTKNSISTRLKKAMIAKLTEDVKKINFGNLLDKLVAHRIQIEMKKVLSKLYPVKSFAVKYMALEKERIYGQEEETVEELQEDVPKEIKEETKEEKKEEAPIEEKKIEVKKETVKETVEKAEEQAAEKTVEKVVEKVEKVPKEEAEKAAEELVEAPKEEKKE